MRPAFRLLPRSAVQGSLHPFSPFLEIAAQQPEAPHRLRQSPSQIGIALRTPVERCAYVLSLGLQKIQPSFRFRSIVVFLRRFRKSHEVAGMRPPEALQLLGI